MKSNDNTVPTVPATVAHWKMLGVIAGQCASEADELAQRFSQSEEDEQGHCHVPPGTIDQIGVVKYLANVLANIANNW